MSTFTRLDFHKIIVYSNSNQAENNEKTFLRHCWICSRKGLSAFVDKIILLYMDFNTYHSQPLTFDNQHTNR